jgi:hypothetical protein
MTDDQAYDLLAHLVASAEICAVEPGFYGTFRLLDAAARLLAVMADSDPWAEGLRRDIEERKLLVMSDRAAYFASLPATSRRVAERLVERQAAR